MFDEFFGESLIRLGLALLPATLRERVHDEVLTVVRERVATARTNSARIGIVAREFLGLIVTAMRARRPDTWSERTVPRPPAFHAALQPVRSPSRTLLVQQTLADIRFAFRTFGRRPMMFGVVILSLALGIGASSAMFTVVDRVLLRPLPFDRPDELVSVYPTTPSLRGHPTLGDLADRGTYSWIEAWEVREHQKSFSDFAAYDQGSATLTGGGTPEQISIGVVMPNLFSLLHVVPELGALFAPSVDADPGRVILLSHGLWQRRLGGRRDIVGTTLSLNDNPYVVLGVLPPHAGTSTIQPDAWIPRVRSARDAEQRGNHTGLAAIARLRPGVAREQAQAEVTAIMHAVTPADHSPHGASVFALQGDRTRLVRPALVILLAAAVLLLLVGCANVAAILLGFGLDRRQEIALRAALGARRGRIVRQLITESLVLATVGGLGGVAVAFAATRLLLLLAPPGVPRIAEVSLDVRAVAVALALAVVSGVLFGTLPALSLARRALVVRTSRGSIGGVGFGQSAVVVGEIALATFLLVGAGLLTRTLVALNHVDAGFRTNALVTVRLSLPFQRFRDVGKDTVDRVIDGYFQRVVEEVATMPGVEGVAVTSVLPLTRDRSNNDVKPEGWVPKGDEQLVAERRFVSSNYFSTVGIRIVDGRAFTPDDDRTSSALTMVISEGLARYIWPHESAVGKRIAFWGRAPSTVIGVAANVRDESLDSDTRFAYYVPFRQVGAETGSLMVHTTVDPVSLIAAIRKRVWAADAGIAIPEILPFEDIISGEVASQRFRARLMLVFAGLAVLFAAMGVYGVTARAVARRTREIGIRLALGALPRRVLSQVLAQGLWLAALGASIGIAVSPLAGRAINRMLYGVKADDPLTLAMIGVLVCLISLIAALPPGRRATRVSPMDALRAD